jgi:hypothetical protein
MKEYSFYVAVYPNGKQSPQIIFNESELENLNNFLGDIYSNIHILDDVILNVKSVLDGKVDSYSFGESERQNIMLKKDETEVYNSFDEFEPFFVQTELIYQVLKDWKDFIIKWKENRIPNLVYPNI